MNALTGIMESQMKMGEASGKNVEAESRLERTGQGRSDVPELVLSWSLSQGCKGFQHWPMTCSSLHSPGCLPMGPAHVKCQPPLNKTAKDFTLETKQSNYSARKA